MSADADRKGVLFDLQDIFERKLKQPSCTQVGSVSEMNEILQSQLGCPGSGPMISICSDKKAADLYNPARVLRWPQQGAMHEAPLHFMMCLIAVAKAYGRELAIGAKRRH